MSTIYNHDNEDGLLTQFFRQKLRLNMFVTCDEFGLLPKPEIQYELDANYLQSLEYYNRLSRNILFPNFYIDDEVRDMTLLKNDKLGITIVLVDSDYDGYNLEFIGVKTIGDLTAKYPQLLESKVR